MRESQNSYLLRGFDGDEFLLSVAQKLSSSSDYFSIISKKVPPFPCNDHINHTYLFSPGLCHKAFPYHIEPAELTDSLDNFLNSVRPFFYRCFDRVCGIKCYPARYIEEYLLELSLLYISYLRALPSNTKVLFACAPCFPDDIALYFAARYLSIETILIRRTLLPDCILLDSSIDVHSNKYYQPSHSFTSNPHFDPLSLLDKQSYWLSFSKLLAHNESRARRLLTTKRTNVIKDLLMRYDSLIMLKQIFATILTSPKRTYFQGSRLTALFTLISRYWQTRLLNVWMNKHSTIPSLTSDYVYFPLHFQPERSTDPDAYVYTYQYHAIKLLSANLPPGFRIYVKEHPRQLQSPWDLRRLHFRSYKDYVRISRLPNVHFVSPSFDSNLLIDKSKLVATPTGSPAWEAIIRSKPSITFGRTWHSTCKASPIAHTDNLASQLTSLIALSPDEISTHKEQFLKSICPYLVNSVNSFESSLHSSIDPSDLTNNLVHSLLHSSL